MGCSVLKKGSKTNNEISAGIGKFGLAKGLEMQNLTGRNFFIQKAEVEYSSGQDKQKFNASIKFTTQGKYLISLRSKTGIEAARIFLSKDTVMINDRINRKLYYGKPDVLSKKYGISFFELPIVLGDYLGDSKGIDENIQCIEGKRDIENTVNEKKMLYTVDCKKYKVLSAIEEGILDEPVTEISFGNFKKADNILTPGKVQIKYVKAMINIAIRIEKVEYPWNGEIEFIPGNKYELVELQ